MHFVIQMVDPQPTMSSQQGSNNHETYHLTQLAVWCLEKEMVHKIILSTNHKNPTHAAQSINRILVRSLHLPAPTTACFFHMYAIRSWFFVRFVTTHTETKSKWQKHSAVRNSGHRNSDPDAVHNNAHPAYCSQTRVGALSCLRFISSSTNSGSKDRTASQRWRYCLRRTLSSDSLSSNHVLLLCKMLSHSAHCALVPWRRKAYQRLRLSPMAAIWAFCVLVISARLCKLLL